MPPGVWGCSEQLKQGVWDSALQARPPSGCVDVFAGRSFPTLAQARITPAPVLCIPLPDPGGPHPREDVRSWKDCGGHRQGQPAKRALHGGLVWVGSSGGSKRHMAFVSGQVFANSYNCVLLATLPACTPASTRRRTRSCPRLCGGGSCSVKRRCARGTAASCCWAAHPWAARCSGFDTRCCRYSRCGGGVEAGAGESVRVGQQQGMRDPEGTAHCIGTSKPALPKKATVPQLLRSALLAAAALCA